MKVLLMLCVLVAIAECAKAKTTKIPSSTAPSFCTQSQKTKLNTFRCVLRRSSRKFQRKVETFRKAHYMNERQFINALCSPNMNLLPALRRTFTTKDKKNVLRNAVKCGRHFYNG
ncbi:hypothetical protein V5799_008117 [Amblyomma americanum]|uniref:Secreted protein n=1 Tax=Amblyomma americanum TaxID=6943 RepID=A0AAQ4FG14_AMBAM